MRMEALPLRAVAHGERLTVIQHLSELRARLLLSVAVLAVLFAGCLSQSRSLLHVLNAPLAHLRTSPASQGPGGEERCGAVCQCPGQTRRALLDLDHGRLRVRTAPRT